MRTWPRQIGLFIFLALNVPLVLWFFKTAYQSSRGFQIFCLTEAAFAAALALFARRFRFLAAGLAIAALPRLASLLLQRELPNVLFPVFFGLALGNSLRAVRMPDPPSLPRMWPAWILAGGILFASFSTFPVYYPSVVEDLALRDSLIAGHVTANFAMHLSLSFALAMLAPLAWILSEAGLRAPGESEAAEICLGLSAGFVLSAGALALQGSVESLRAGVTDHAFEAGRRPGLFSDSGASNVLFPSLCVIASFTLVSFRKAQGGALKQALPILFAGIFCAFTSFFQGKAVFISMAGIALVWPWLSPSNARPSRSAAVFLAALGVLAAALLIHLKAPGIAEKLRSGDLRVDSVLSAVDPVRALLLGASGEIFLESPWVGHGLNSFVPRLMLLKSRRPELFPENPPGLIPGILNDSGILGLVLCIFVTAAAACLIAGRLKDLQNESSVPLRLLVFLPVSLAPVFFVGYHILFAEISAFCLLPLLFLAARPTSASVS